MPRKLSVLPGISYPLGATMTPRGVNFSLFSKNAEAVDLLLFDREDHTQPTHVIQLDPDVNKTFYYWHVHIPGLQAGQLYGYRVYGPYRPSEGLRFDGSKVLIDPHARAVVTDTYSREAATRPGDNCATAIKSVVIDPADYDWEGDRPLKHPFAKSVIYELHVGGFTRHPSSGLAPELRGTFRGVIEKIPYLKELGITSVELMPVQQFDPFDVPNSNLTNYWGYSPIALFAPHNGYGTSDDPVQLIREFRDMVKALHRAGIEVILDVVFNHTAEGNENGPTLSFRGLENRGYYMLEEDRRYYRNFSGTGNTLNGNHSVVRRLIRHCLRHWVTEMHVDGFRFDLASVLSRDERGRPMENPPILWEIESDPVLASSKIIAEAWDVGTYQLGSFVGDKWAEWNGHYRDVVRRFVKGDQHSIGDFAEAIAGSPSLFGSVLRNPNRSINFVTCHDGFTLNDLVSYNEKHNLANGEGNRDGHNDNHSWNCGAEGPTSDPGINALRTRQIKNFFTILMCSQGTPMLLMGDEICRTQHGNNNAYCQDNELAWFDWSAVEKEEGMLRFVQKLIQFNLSHDFFQKNHYWMSPAGIRDTQFSLHGTQLNRVDWGGDSHALSYHLASAGYGYQLFIMVNAFWEPLRFELPHLHNRHWRLIIDTAQPSPNDFCEYKSARRLSGFFCEVGARSVVVAMKK